MENYERKINTSLNMITVDELKFIIAEAIHAPTGDNSQHWRFTWNGSTLAIFYEKERGAHALNNNHHATFLALGCLLEQIEISASSLQFSIEESLQLNAIDKGPLAILRFNRGHITTDDLFHAVELRWVERRPFKKTILKQEVIEHLKNIASEFTTCSLEIKSSITQSFRNYLIRADYFMWKNKNVLVDFLKWIRLSRKEVNLESTGMSWQSLNLNALEAFFFRLIRLNPFLVKFLWILGFKLKVKKNSESLIDSSSAFYCISVKNYDFPSIVQVGRLSLRIWIYLNSIGYGVQPLSLASMTALDFYSGFPPPGSRREDFEFFKKGFESLKSEFSFGQQDIPIWLFRTGEVGAMPSYMRSKRMLVEEVFKVYTRK